MNRAERRRRTAHIVRQRLEFVARIWIDGVPPKSENYVRNYIGRCKTMHPYDCGRPRCGVCSGYKRFRAGPTRKELLFEFDFEEQIRELENES